VSAHRAIIEVGPGTIRRLCCGTSTVVEAEMCAAALDAIDDRVALADEVPVAVEPLWRTVLRSLHCGSSGGLTVVHPSWWPPSRVGVVTAAAPETNQLEAHPRSWLLTQAWSDTGPDATVVEIADRLVAVSAAEVVAVPRTMQPPTVAHEVASLIAATMRAVVLIDAPGTVAGAAALATLIADAVRDGGAQTVIEIDDARLRQLARRASQLRSDSDEPRSTGGARGSRSRARRGWLAAAGVVVVAAVPAVGALATMARQGVSAAHTTPTTFLVEGRVALTVPANWRTQRVVGGPGSARVQVTSPSDPEVALHVTQSPVAGETLSGTAERLKRAIDAEPAGVFVDFNPYGTSAGRPAVTYREVRAGHQVRWTVLLDGVVRISVGCQSRPGGEDAVRDVCEQAVRSAHAISDGTKPWPQQSE
jgi:type VII secretion-associated protein (TIGR03931 family)